ncbi:uncharacterized protein LOC114078396 [Solanum pennellii]|uniref:Uncharacterized protein LOC114078396 n=1 Tax=Solanum pennellii TaxID=28526 RepID=A0ABM1VH44_SOLPN|nr:uncharacterized protein LOC114078396 [Solanum pennellii]
MKRRIEEPLEQLLKTHASFKGFEGEKSYKGNGQWRGCGGRRGRGRGRSYTNHFNNEDKGHQSFRGRGRGQRGGRGCGTYQGTNEMRYDKSKVERYNCHKIGHNSWECRNNVEEKVNLVDNNRDENESTLLLTLTEENKDDCSSWYLDMEQAMCGHKDRFVEIKKNVKGNVSFGDTSKLQIEGIGMILISSKDGAYKLITNVYYMPKLKSNSLSLGQLIEKGYNIHMKNIHLWLRDSSNNLTAKVHVAKNRLFPLNLQRIDAKCLKANVQDDSWCWDMKFGYLNFKGLKSMGDKNMVDGIPSIKHPNQLCEASLLGKHARKSFPKETTSRTTYAHVPHQGRAKLDDRSAKYVFVVYDASSKGYKLYNPKNNKVVVSRDIEFDEDTQWNWEAPE